MQDVPTGPVGEDADRIISVLKRRRTVQIVGLVILVVFTAVAILSRLADYPVLGLPSSFWVALAVGLLIAKLLLNILGWRCPKCGGRLGSGYSPKYCSNCGFRFVPDNKERNGS